jgi:hypothetical protein
MFDGAEFGRQMAIEVKNALAPLTGKIAAFEKRIAQLELCGEVKHVGIWREGAEYLPGNFTTTNGSLWHCEQPTRSRPGTDATWKMAVKRGVCE